MTNTLIHDLVFSAAERFGADLALIDHDGCRFSWLDYAGAVREAAAVLSGAHIAPGDRVMIVAENSVAAAAFVFGASLAGAIAVPVNARMSAPELARIAGHALPRLTVWTTDVSAEAKAHAAAAGATPVAGGFGHVSIKGDAPPAVDIPPAADVVVLLYTTGTTGDPKGVELTQGNLTFAGQASATLRGMRPGDVIYGALPMTHVFGLASMLMAGATAGAAIRLAPRFRADRLLAALREDVTMLPAVPQMHALLMQHVASLGEDKLTGSELRYVSSGAAPLDPAWKRKAEAFYGLALQNGYGMTETTAGVSSTRNPIGSPDTSVGKPLPGVEVRLDTSLGSEPGVGEVLTRGPHVMAGYFRNPQETARAIGADGFLRTGDLGRIDEDGNLHIVGRAKELIIRSGFNVYPPEVEAAFNDHPMVVQCAVIGRRVEGGNEEVLAFVQCVDPSAIDLEEMKAFVAARLTSYKRPSHIILTTQLPAASTGKILKHQLLEAFKAQLT
ncbi:class I adenylate-forming enzyme family protein [Nitratireductor sp. ZSWI3]|uniref:class I adenylate-forming enzyme family protein n=1 Tax=Nitratireductor sp. ZSWI3 TaxID=2966359 RepID=UPI00214F9F83|nr:class I adenylate-forming enzyme family protein [Nitratireductor sp. ZSWI3]MCR4267562.1 acyl--CoA ligase [Nitratireductor sp. ZSWI3]